MGSLHFLHVALPDLAGCEWAKNEEWRGARGGNGRRLVGKRDASELQATYDVSRRRPKLTERLEEQRSAGPRP